MVVQVLAHARQVVDDRDAVAWSSAARADAGELQELRRADGAGGEHDLATRRVPSPGPSTPQARRRSRAFAIARLDDHPLHVRVGEQRQVRADASAGRSNALRGAPAHAAPLVHVEVGVAEVVAAVEFVDLGDAALLGRVAPRVEDLPAHARLLDAELAVAAVVLVGAAEVPRRA